MNILCLSLRLPPGSLVVWFASETKGNHVDGENRFDRRRFAKVSAGVAAAATLATAVRAGAQDVDPTEAASQTATVEAEGVQVSTEEEGKTNVSWWTHNNPVFVQGNKDLIAKFEAANPDIHIVYQYFPYDVFVQKLQTGYRSGSVADVQQMFGSWVTEYARNQLLAPMPDEIAATMEARFWPAAIGSYQFDGKYYGQPKEYNLENGGILTNPAILQTGGYSVAPKTWDELVDMATKLTIHDGDKITQSGFTFMVTDTITFLFLSLILQQGASYWADDGVHVNLSSDAAKAAWKAETDFVVTYKVDDTTSFTGDSQDRFFRGQSAMCMRGPWAIPLGREQFPDLAFTYDPIPVFQGTEPKFAAESGWGEVVNASIDDDKKAAAWKFVDFMHQDENLRGWNITTSTVPSLQSLNNDPQILDAFPGLAVSFAALPYGQWVGNVGDRDRFWKSIVDAITNVSLGRKSPEDALSDAEQEINAMIDEKMGP
jgi:multiple sugar transport system substrate-binding protein